MTPRPSPRTRSALRLAITLIVVAVLATLAWMAVKIGNPFPPRALRMATGPEGSASHEFGARYREILQRSGIDLVLVSTAGGVENLADLHDRRSGVSIAFLESGLTNREASPDLVSLGTISVQPLWTFFRSDLQPGPLAEQVRGKRISIEPIGSATRVLAQRLFALNGVDSTQADLLDLAPEAGAESLLRGEIDGVVMLTSWNSPAVRKLLAADGVVLVNHPRADAYVALFPSLDKVVLPTGVADLARNIPPAPVQLLAVEASLVAHRNLHPALQYLLLEAASEIHGGPDVFHRAGRFPAPQAISLPLSNQARQYYKSGRPLAYRYLPFALASLVEHLLIALIPLFAVVYPVAQLLPSVYRSVVERRMFKLYGELKLIELELATARGQAVEDLATRLNNLEKRADRLHVPLGYAQRLFILKSHIGLAQQDVEKHRSDASTRQ